MHPHADAPHADAPHADAPHADAMRRTNRNAMKPRFECVLTQCR
jgi:hypothetical protein